MAENLDNGQKNLEIGDANAVAQQPNKLFTQEEVQAKLNDVAGKVRSEAYQKGLKDGSVSVPQVPISAPVSSNPQIMQSQQPQPPQQGLTTDDVNRMLLQHQTNLQAQQIAQQFNGKLEAGRSKYNDFDTTLKSLQENLTPNDYANLVLRANNVENSADIMYNIAKNPEKLAKIIPLIYISPHHANIAIQDLSSSIKQNETAAKQKQAREPLGQIEHSNVGVDNGDMNNMSVTDFRKMFR